MSHSSSPTFAPASVATLPGGRKLKGLPRAAVWAAALAAPWIAIYELARLAVG